MPDLIDILRMEPPEAAPRLIGCMLSREIEGQVVRGIITETEAYTADDPASHSYRGQSVRNAAMFGEPGDIYVYLIYGLHYCFNIVTGTTKGGAVLIRSVEITDGLKVAWQNRYKEPLPLAIEAKKRRNLSNGPAKVAEVFGIDARFNHANLLDPASVMRLSIAERHTNLPVIQTPRIGITKAADVAWRWVVQRG